LAVVGHRLHRAIARRIRQRTLAAGLAVAMLIVTVMVPIVLVGKQLVGQASAAFEAARAALEEDRWQALVRRIPGGPPVLDWIIEHVDLDGAGEQASAFVSSRLGSFVTGSVWVVLELLVAIVALFYFFRDRRESLETLRCALPLSDREADEMFNRIGETIHATVYGSLAVAAIQGLLGGLMFWILGLPAPLLWGVVMALLSTIPNLGSFVVWAPAAVGLALSGQWGKALALCAWGAVAIGLIDNLLYPVLVGRRLHFHPLPVFFSILGGLLVFGASGLILGPLVLAITDALLRVWRDRTRAGHAADEAGVGAEPTAPETRQQTAA
jgi:predicted PurR-regulated permease PerM